MIRTVFSSKIIILYIIILFMLTGCKSEEKTFATLQKVKGVYPIVKKTELLLPEEHSRPRSAPITHVVIHFMSNVAAKPEDPFRIEDMIAIFKEYGLSTHYVIDREGKIYNLVPEKRAAFHAGEGKLPLFPGVEDVLNDYSIGIELMAIGTKEEMAEMITGEQYDAIPFYHLGYTDAQYHSLNFLLHEIHERYPTIKRTRDHVIGHDEYAPGRKTDPGALFDWSRIGY